MSDVLTIAHFENLLKSEFEIISLDPKMSMTLIEVSKKAMGDREGGAFAVLWQGPKEPLLPQSTQKIAHPELGEHDIFIVPVSQLDDATQYEAIFT